VWKNNSKVDVRPDELEMVLKSSYFNKVTDVGLNGGEPSLHSSLDEVVSAVISLKKLKNIYLISNGINAVKLLPGLENAKSLCEKKRVRLHLTISIDGVDNIHDDIRGITGSFIKSIDTIKVIKKYQSKYCDSLSIGVTISNENVNYLAAIKVYLEDLGVAANYHIAVPNKRIDTFYESPYSIMNDRYLIMLAREYFYGIFKFSTSFKERISGFMNYYYLINRERIATCDYLRSDITIDENLDLYLCATASEKIGSLKQFSPSYYIKNKSFNKVLKETEVNCKECDHYVLKPTIRGAYLYIKECLSPIIWIRYMIKANLKIY
jgi:MoaA/NifB/PqqE/SkfB family radical SAM enzyme